MILVPLGVVFAGYQLMWYGFANLKGPRMGFLDLLLPSRVEKANSIIASWGSGSPGNVGGNAGRNVNNAGTNPNPGTRVARGQM